MQHKVDFCSSWADPCPYGQWYQSTDLPETNDRNTLCDFYIKSLQEYTKRLYNQTGFPQGHFLISREQTSTPRKLHKAAIFPTSGI